MTIVNLLRNAFIQTHSWRLGQSLTPLPMIPGFVQLFRWSALLATLLLLVHFSAAADFIGDWSKMKQIQPRNYICPRAAAPIRIDGQLNDAGWATAEWTKPFADIEGPAKPQPRFRTRAKMLWDDAYFYVGAELEEPHVWGTLTNRDSVIFRDNDFEVFIDPDGDTHEYYEFEMNALNTVWDLFLRKPYKDGGPAINEWNIAGLKTAVHVSGTLNSSADRDAGWSIEIAFPWAALAEYAHRPAPPHPGDQWRVNFSRVEWDINIVNGQYQKVPNRPEHNWVWSPQGIVDMHRPEKWGYVQFAAGPVAPRFNPDIAAEAKNVLFEIYYRQRQFKQSTGRFADSLKELGWNPPGKRVVRIELSATGFVATVESPVREGNSQRWIIREDSKLEKIE